MFTHNRLASLLALLPAMTSIANGERITTGSLISEMTDMHRLAEFPSPSFKTVQFSSYDHRSTVPGGSNWFANSDGFGGEPVPNFAGIIRKPDEEGVGEYLICDVDGPGAIVRCWTAAIAGDIRMYLDGAEEPVFDGTADDFLRRPYDVFADSIGIDKAVFDGTFNQRNATYCPIPFAERCRIVWIGKVKDIHFYEVQIRLYEAGADVMTFKPDDLRIYQSDLQSAATVLADPSGAFEYTSERDGELMLAATIEPGESGDLLRIEEGPGAIEQLSLNVRAADLDLALRQTLMYISYDGYTQAHVQSPIGDFFGAAPGVNPYDSIPFNVDLDGTMTCRFVMPFETSMHIRLENRSQQQVTVTGSAQLMDYAWDKDRSMHFRARWRVDHDLVADPKAVQDIPFLLANGTGRYVGTASIMLNPTDVPTPAGGWWGEGDEKIFVDDDEFPSTFGTGSEDYYNYAWSSPDIFLFPYCGQPRNDGPGNRGFVTNNRWHILDSLPFSQRIAFYMELYSHKRTPGYSYARIAYHYARPGITDDHTPITDEDVRSLDLPANWRPLAWWGAQNSKFLEPESILEASEIGSDITYVEDNLYSVGRLMLWRPQREGESIMFTVPITETGQYVVDLCAAKTGRSGAFRTELSRADGSIVNRTGPDIVDLSSPGRTSLRRISYQPVELDAGRYSLKLFFVGEPGREIGIDYVWVQKH